MFVVGNSVVDNSPVKWCHPRCGCSTIVLQVIPHNTSVAVGAVIALRLAYSPPPHLPHVITVSSSKADLAGKQWGLCSLSPLAPPSCQCSTPVLTSWSLPTVMYRNTGAALAGRRSYGGGGGGCALSSYPAILHWHPHMTSSTVVAARAHRLACSPAPSCPTWSLCHLARQILQVLHASPPVFTARQGRTYSCHVAVIYRLL